MKLIDDAKQKNAQYWNAGILYKIASRLYQRTIKGRKLVIDIEMHQRIRGHWSPQGMETVRSWEFSRSDTWQDTPATQLQNAGYKKIDGLYDSIIFWGVPVYCQIHGGQRFDVSSARDAAGNLIYSQDTSATLNDFMQSSATQNFIKGMGKTALPAMDLQKIVMIAVIAAGAFFGMYMLGIF